MEYSNDPWTLPHREAAIIEFFIQNPFQFFDSHFDQFPLFTLDLQTCGGGDLSVIPDWSEPATPGGDPLPPRLLPRSRGAHPIQRPWAEKKRTSDTCTDVKRSCGVEDRMGRFVFLFATPRKRESPLAIEFREGGTHIFSSCLLLVGSGCCLYCS